MLPLLLEAALGDSDREAGVGAAKEGGSRRENVWVLGLTKEVSSSDPKSAALRSPLYSPLPLF